METFVTQIEDNKRKTWLLLTIFVILLAVVGGTIGLGISDGDRAAAGVGALVGFAMALGGSLYSYFQGSSVLMSIAGAREIVKADDPELFNVVEEMAIAAGVPMPRIFLIEDSAMNAFATGRDPAHAAVAITTGLREKLSRDELQAVIAHEVGHVVNYDIRLAMLIAVLSGVIVLMCDFFWRSIRTGGRRRRSNKNGGGNAIVLVLAVVLAVLAPIVAKLLQLAVSRQREYLADSTAVQLCRNPLALASALRKLTGDTEALEAANRATEHLYIVSPTKKLDAANIDSVWSTHPPINKRIARLVDIAT